MRTRLAAEAGRRAWLAGATVATATTVVGTSSPAFAGAPVGEGGLPDGARQFSNVLLQQREWTKIGKRVREGGSSVGKNEWKNIQLYTRKLYAASDDMADMAKTLDADKKTKAQDLIKEFRASVKSSDSSIVANDASSFLAVYDTTAKQLDDFLAIFSDVPDEL